MAAERKEDFNKQRFISATIVSGLPRSFILQLCIFCLRCNFEENSLHFSEVSCSHGFILQAGAAKMQYILLHKPDTIVTEINHYIRK